MSPMATLLIECHDSVRDMVRHALLMSKVEDREVWELAASEVKSFETDYANMGASVLALVARCVTAKEDYPPSPCWRMPGRKYK